MRFATVAALATGASAAVAIVPGNGTVYTTEVVTAYTTYCPAPTTITQGGKTYTVTKATTLTLDCPCTISKPVTSAPAVVTSKAGSSVPVVVPTTKATSAPVVVVPTGGAAPPANGTATYKAPTGGATTTGPVTTFTGAANKAFAASGAGLAAVFGLAAYVL